ncbi:hypothetical protein P8452_27064 [Trifolium repens]|nr:hypothetical protein P8452_27064 [Trifolium repens]
MTCTLQNFDVEKNVLKNNLAAKVTEHQFKLVFTGGTLLEDVNVHKISNPRFKFRYFADINNGKVPYDLLIAFHEMGYTQLVHGGRKLQVNFKLKDLSGNFIKCTLWEDFATQFANFNKQRTDWGPTIVLLHNCKIKDATDLYELCASNVWNGTKLFINVDLPEITTYKEGLGIEECFASQSQQLSSQSQMLSQSTQLTQYTPTNKFLSNALILPLKDVLNLPEAQTCVTVVKTLKIVPTRLGWYYKLCSQCRGSAKGYTLPIKCDKGHETHVINMRYKLDVEVEAEGFRTTFVFWDRECNELLGKTATQLHMEMVEIEVRNPLEYPLVLDKIGGRTLACKVKLQQNWGNYSVSQARGDDVIIEKIRDQFPKNEETSKYAIGPSESSKLDDVLEPSLEDVVVSDNKGEGEQLVEDSEPVIPLQDLFDSSENDPDQVSMTPAKRNASTQSAQKDIESPAPTTKGSSTKLNVPALKRIIKREKRT